MRSRASLWSLTLLLSSTGTILGTLPPVRAADKPKVTAEDALKLSPRQKRVPYSVPSKEEAPQCTVTLDKRENESGWIVRDPAGQILRDFTATGGNKNVDRWSYFQDGVETYRETDTNQNGKPEEYRWLNSGGTRLGLDTNEDGAIDVWKRISAEEVSEEVVHALADRDAAAFQRLLLSPEELKELGLGEGKLKEVQELVAGAGKAFETLSKGSKSLAASARWVSFGGIRPGVFPAGTDGSKKDLVVYENILAMADNGGKPAQLSLGALIRVGDAWRLVAAPAVDTGAGSEVAVASLFFKGAPPVRPEAAGGAPSDNEQKLLADLEKLDKAMPAASKVEALAEYQVRRTELLAQLVDATKDENRAQWLRQLADNVSAAMQGGNCPPKCMQLLVQARDRLDAEKESDLVAYVAFRLISGEYGEALAQPGANIQKVNAKWFEDLEAFVEKFPKSPDAPDAILQLAIGQEFAGEDNDAKKWYTQIISRFPDTPPARKAAGARTRLDSVGKAISLRGPAIAGGKTVDLKDYKGKVVLVQYWATWSDQCLAEMEKVAELHAKYSKQGFEVIGVNLDDNKEDAVAQANRLKTPWSHIHEPGGLESRPATEMGIVTVPTMLLVGAKGEVINRNLHVTELATELKRQFKAK